jgi:hypothetical protein
MSAGSEKMERLLKDVARQCYTDAFRAPSFVAQDAAKSSQECAEAATKLFEYMITSEVFEVLKRRLLPLLEAAEDMRYQEWPENMSIGPARDWDVALAAAQEQP